MAGGGGGLAGFFGRRVEGGENISGFDSRKGIRGGGVSMRVCGVVVVEGSARGLVRSDGSLSTFVLVVPVEMPSWLRLFGVVLPWRVGRLFWA